MHILPFEFIVLNVLLVKLLVFGIERLNLQLRSQSEGLIFLDFSYHIKGVMFVLILKGRGNNSVSEEMRSTIRSRFILLRLFSFSSSFSFDTIPELYPFHSETAKSDPLNMSGGAWPVKFHSIQHCI